MLPQDLIRRKRDGAELTDAEIEGFVTGLVDGSLGAEQAAAFAMAVFFQGMSTRETVTLTRAMAASGSRLEWAGAGLDGPVVDKHSTGGVGDKVSLILAPLVAACGGYVPMISGRGLDHTGGTLDKLEAIPGYTVDVPEARLVDVVRRAGCAIVAATAALAPADRRLYAIRDVTATVDIEPMIVASILSKKLAEGLDALVMDVKTGSGAFAPAPQASRRLARALVDIACGAGLPTRALVTDMDQVLGTTAGNALEVEESVRFLRGEVREPRLERVVLALGAEMLVASGLARDAPDAERRLRRRLDDGSAAERFAAMVHALGGPAGVVESPERHLPRAPVVEPVYPQGEGYVHTVDVRAIGRAVVGAGGGRRRPEDVVDLRVGFSDVAGKGVLVDARRPLALVHASDAGGARGAAEALRAAVAVASEVPGPVDPVHDTIA